MDSSPTNYEQAVAHEEENRLLAYLGLGRPVFGRVLAQLRWQHVLELSLAQNSFFTSAEPTAADVDQLLWRLDLAHRLPDGTLDNLPPGLPRPSRFASWRARIDCWRIARRLPANALELPLRAWLAAAKQDAPGFVDSDAPGAKPRSSLAPTLNDFDGLVAMFGLRDPAELLRMGVAFTFQNMRAAAIASGDSDRIASFIPPSAALLRFAPDPQPSTGAPA